MLEAEQPVAGTAKAGPQYHLLALVVALVGGVLGIAGAAVQELAAGGAYLIIFVGAPVIEEAMKPAGVYLLLIRWPQALRGQLYTAVLAALAGLAFGAIESLLYVTLYVGDPAQWFVIYRFSVPLALHGAASFVYGLGINRGLIDWAAGGGPFPKPARNFYLAAVLMHGVFNTVAFSLELSGVLDFD